MRRVLAWAWVACAACSAAPVTLELPRIEGAQSFLVAAERGDAVVEVAALDVDRTDQAGPHALLEVGDDETVAFTVLGLDLALDTAGIEPGVHRPSVGEDDLTLGRLDPSEGLFRAEVLAGERTAWQPLPELPAALARTKIPSRRACRRFVVQSLPPLPDSAMFIAPIFEGHLIGTAAQTLHFVPPNGMPVEVTPEPEGDVRFPTFAAITVSEIPGELWVGGKSGRLWHVAMHQDGRVARVIARHDIGRTDSIHFLAGHASRHTTQIYYLTSDGSLGLFDGTTARELFAFDDNPDVFVSGGIARASADTFVAVRSTDDVAIVIEDRVPFQVRVSDAGIGLYGLGMIEDLGLLVSDARGRLFIRSGSRFEPFGQTAIPAGAQAIIDVDSGFLVSGGEGALQEWRTEGGFCPLFPPLVTQSLRFWAPRADGSFLVSGPDPDVVGVPTTPLSIFRDAP